MQANTTCCTRPVHAAMALYSCLWLFCGAISAVSSLQNNNRVTAFVRPAITPSSQRPHNAAAAFAATHRSSSRAADNRQQSRISGSSKSKRKKKERKRIPESELIKRRKSPALWRYDLSNAEVDEDDAEQQPCYPLQPPEIMAPAGGFPQLSAAIANGADSIYLGCSAFSARARATNFDPVTELPRAVRIAHESDVKVYVALNTLVFNHELSEVAQLIRQIDQAGADALIVQDLGVCKICAQVAPWLEIHASTQQSVTSADGVRHAASLGANRVVLGRELSVREIESVTKDVRKDSSLQDLVGINDSIETEVFVHGALCVSYSGQCFSSEAWGGRSANRGQCAQACRLPYGLVTDGVLTNLGDVQYLLSPQDLSGLEQVDAFVRAGVSCLKIEGRLKSAEYVAATTRAYRNAVDKSWEELCREEYDVGLIDDSEMKRLISLKKRALSFKEEVNKKELAQLFSRGQDEDNDGLTPGFFEGPHHQRLVRGRSPRHRGVHIGRVSLSAGSSPKRGIVIRSHDENTLSSLKRGDGLVIDRGSPQDVELGGPIYAISDVWSSDGDLWSVEVRFGREVMQRWAQHDGPIRMRQGGEGYNSKLLVPENAHVWRTSDAAVEKKIRRLAEAAPPRSLVRVSVRGKVGERLTVAIESSDGQRRGIGQSDGSLEAAEGAGLAPKQVKKAVGRLGATSYGIENDEIDTNGLGDGLWCPISWIKEARRKAIEAFESSGKGSFNHVDDVVINGAEPNEVVEKLVEGVSRDSNEEANDTEQKHTTRLSILARSYEQVDRICRMAEDGELIDEIIVDFLEVDGMKDAVARIREVDTVQAIVASPRVIKPGECGIWRTLLRLEPDGLLIRSAGLLHKMQSLGGEGATVNLASKIREEEDCLVTIPSLLGDFSLNAANVITAGELLSEGLQRVTAAYDLNANAITDLAEAMGPTNAARLDVIAHAHLPIFHTEHCVFARFLSEGNSYVDCGHACTRHTVHLRDQSGADNLVLADMGCRNTVFTAQAQSGVHSIKEWRDVGIGRLRVELVDEEPEDVEQVITNYLGVLSGDIRPRDAWENLKHIRDSNGREGGVSHGSLRNGVERRAGEISNDRFYEDVY